ncbi:hypothetical protein ACFPAG_16525 [Vogesella sp. GCM10023246]|uniref:Uncharacterized protein n=1 Tax=Vogesella oryzagri TaxID=3160864 RepID=A0ABV1M7Q0_9NEIS
MNKSNFLFLKMDKQSAKHFIVTALKDCETSCNNGYLAVKMLADNHSNFCNALRIIGYAGEEPKLHSDQKLYFEYNGEEAWPNGVFFYENLQKYWSEATGKAYPSISHEFYLISEKIYSTDSLGDPLIRTMFSLAKINSILTVAKDFHLPSGNEYAFFVNAEHGIQKFEICTSLKYSELAQINPLPLDVENISNLYEKITNPDAHSSERREVIRAVLAELHKICQGKLDPKLILQHSGFISKNFTARFDLYVHKFSTSRLINEIDSKTLEYISKVNEYISDSQGKVLVVPGAIIATAALVKDSGMWVAFLVCIGSWLAHDFVHAANDIHLKSLEILKKQVNENLSSYMELSTDVEIREHAGNATAQVNELIAVSEGRIKKINTGALIMVIISITFGLCRIIFADQFQ